MRALLILAITAACWAQSIPATSDEWVGPFSSWKNAKTDCGAVGNGTTNDSPAIQACLNAFTVNNSATPVLYFPAGTYKITTGLTLTDKIDIALIGHSNSDTSILWAGSAGGSMLTLNGVAYSKFSRLKFSGATTAGFCVDQSWDGSGGYFDTGNEYSDIVWDHCRIAYRCGFLGSGCAETSILRNTFDHASIAGVALYNFNALDIWIWYSTFDTCAIGVTNSVSGSGAGNYHVYNSNFLNTVGPDLYTTNTGGFSARGNYSIGSNRFWEASFTGNAAEMALQGNTILDSADDTPIYFQNEGPQSFIDNTIRSSTGYVTGTPVIHSSGFSSATATVLGNTYGNASMLAQETSVDVNISYANQVVARNTINPTQPVLPPELPNLSRTIIEVAQGANTAAIQTAINTAAALNGTRPVVHIPWGSYSITATLSVPVCDLQIIGDGGYGGTQGTILAWSGGGAGPVISLAGPSRVTHRDVEVNGNGTVDGIVIENADQVGARVYSSQLYLQYAASTTKNLHVNGLDNAYVWLEDYQQTDQTSYVTGGAAKQIGTTAGKVNIFSGASSSQRAQWDITSGGTVLIRDLWYESNFTPAFLNVHGKATFTLDGARISTGGSPQPFVITALNGLVTITEAFMDQGFTISGSSGSGSVLGLGCQSGITNATPYFTDTTSPAGDNRLLSCRNAISPNVGAQTDPTPSVGTASQGYIETMLAQTRGEMPVVLTALATPLTDVRLFRVRVYNGVTNLKINAGSTTPGGVSFPGKTQFPGKVVVQ